MIQYRFWKRRDGHPPKDYVRIAHLSTGELVRYDLAVNASDNKGIQEYMRVTIWEWIFLGEGVIHSIDGRVMEPQLATAAL